MLKKISKKYTLNCKITTTHVAIVSITLEWVGLINGEHSLNGTPEYRCLNVTINAMTNVATKPYIKMQQLSTNYRFLKFESNGNITTINFENDIKTLSNGERILKFKLMLNKKKQAKLD